MNSLLSLLVVYDGCGSDSDARELESVSLFQRNVDPCNLVVSKRPPVWQISFSGFNVHAYLSKMTDKLIVYFNAPSLPSCVLHFKLPLPPRTFVMLPGSRIVLEFSKEHEVSVLNVDGNHTEEQDSVLNRIIDLLEGILKLDDEDYAQMAGGVPENNSKSDDAFMWEVIGAKQKDEEEAVIKVSLYKTQLRLATND